MSYQVAPYQVASNLGANVAPFEFRYYNINTEKKLVFKFDKASKFTLTNANVASRTVEQPVVANSKAIYSDENTEAQRPIATSNSEYLRITTTAINGSIRSLSTVNLSNYSHVVLVAKAPTASVAGKLKLSQTAGTQESVCTFTTDSVANTWTGGYNDTPNKAFIFPFKTTNASENVTVTGTPNWSAVNIELSLDTITSADAFEVYFCNNKYEAIGVELVRLYTCIDSVSPEKTIETVDIICNSLVEGVNMTGRQDSISLVYLNQSISGIATEDGTTIEYANMPIRRVPVNYTVSAGAITLPDSNKVAYIRTQDGITLTQSTRTATVSGYEFTQNGATITVPTTFNGQVLEISQMDLVSIPSVVEAGLPSKIYGQFLMRQLTNDNQNLYMRGYKSQLIPSGYSAEKGADKKTDKIRFLPDPTQRIKQTGLA